MPLMHLCFAPLTFKVVVFLPVPMEHQKPYFDLNSKNDTFNHNGNSFILFYLFIWFFPFNSGIFHSYWNVTIAGVGSVTLHRRGPANFDLWSLDTHEQWEFFTCNTYCNAGYSFIMVISENLCHSHQLPSV